ncbi:MAG TPA: hypothetical protein VM012_10045 [Flavitalea sp.]|nr:hypothetical protein [Flavitalea sp.]
MQTSISLSPKRAKCKRKFLRHFRDGYQGEKFISWEREYKWQAHLSWKEQLNREDYERLLDAKQFEVISNTAVKIETKTNLLFSFEKMALRDAVKSAQGAKAFAKGLYDYVYGTDNMESRFSTFGEVLDSLPRVQTRVHTWPLHTVFGFIANPRQFIFMKPRVTQVAALNYDFEFNYRSRPNWDSYQSLIAFAEEVRNDTADLRPRDYIDLQSFIWVMGSEEY